MFAQLLGAPPQARAAERKVYGLPVAAADAPVAMKAAVGKWGSVVRHFACSEEDQAHLISALQALAEGKSEWGEVSE